tara:strand:- start:2958 stop:3386 length:429 start_codon:yes stop_codon:yes gene_type:complete
MINIKLRSRVARDMNAVNSMFDEALFQYLLPPGAELIEFGGSKKGDIVHLRLPLAGEWISEITEDGKSEHQCYFIDEGRQLPFPLKKWKHRHVLHRDQGHTIVEDDMSYSTGNALLDLLFYPVLLFSFLPRIWQYKSYFKEV